jgi:hypothetical protein
MVQRTADNVKALHLRGGLGVEPRGLHKILYDQIVKPGVPRGSP